MELSKIKNIIFDLGGVILNIDYDLTDKEFKKLGISNFKYLFSQAKQSSLFDDLEKGLITPEHFNHTIRTLSNSTQLTDGQISTAWNAMLLDLPKERIHLLKGLKKKFRTFLLSNTNAIHERKFMRYIDETYGKEVFINLFDRVYFSHHLQLRKPDREIFEYVIKENQINPAETLFIDDSVQHIEGAETAGINALLLQKGESITKLFESLYGKI